MYFEFEKLDVYNVTLDFVAVADDVAETLPRGRRYLKDQLRRGANSIAANLAEGVGEYSPAERLASTVWRGVLPSNAPPTCLYADG